jgi:hypothetical protein
VAETLSMMCSSSRSGSDSNANRNVAAVVERLAVILGGVAEILTQGTVILSGVTAMPAVVVTTRSMEAVTRSRPSGGGGDAIALHLPTRSCPLVCRDRQVP